MKVCKFCGAEIHDTATSCPSCGGNEFKTKCANCGNVYDDGGFCPRCGVKAGATAKKCPKCGKEYFSAACPDCGYTPNQQPATVVVRTAAPQPQPPQKKRKTWLWVLGWIFIFPVPLTILMLRNKSMKKWLKIAIIAAAWLLYIILVASSANSESNANTTAPEKATEGQQTEAATEANPTEVAAKATDDLVACYNAAAPTPLEFAEDFTPSDKESSHYRTEFRLTAFNDAAGKSYRIGDQVVDIVAAQNILGDVEIRVYTDDAGLEFCSELATYMVPLIDQELPEDEVQTLLLKVAEGKELNEYPGHLTLTLSTHGDEGYELMIRTN